MQLSAKDKTFTIVIDAGHGGQDPGALGAGVDEKTINLSIALKFGNLISKNMDDVNVVYTRKNDVFIGLDERTVIANRNKANLFISIHANAMPGKSSRSRRTKGTEIYVMGLASSEESLDVAKRENSVIQLEKDYRQKYEGFNDSAESYIMISQGNREHLEQSIRMATETQKAFKEINRNDRDVRQAGFLVLRRASMASVLIEVGFLSNAEEEKYLKSAAGQNELALALYKAFAAYKHEHDKYRSIITRSQPVRSQPAKQQGKAAAAVTSKVYRIQILASKEKFAPGSQRLKGYKDIEIIESNGYYRYLYGRSTDYDTIHELHKKVVRDFKDAFIVSFITTNSISTTKKDK